MHTFRSLILVFCRPKVYSSGTDGNWALNPLLFKGGTQSDQEVTGCPNISGHHRPKVAIDGTNFGQFF